MIQELALYLVIGVGEGVDAVMSGTFFARQFGGEVGEGKWGGWEG